MKLGSLIDRFRAKLLRVLDRQLNAEKSQKPAKQSVDSQGLRPLLGFIKDFNLTDLPFRYVIVLMLAGAFVLAFIVYSVLLLMSPISPFRALGGKSGQVDSTLSEAQLRAQKLRAIEAEERAKSKIENNSRNKIREEYKIMLEEVSLLDAELASVKRNYTDFVVNEYLSRKAERDAQRKKEAEEIADAERKRSEAADNLQLCKDFRALRDNARLQKEQLKDLGQDFSNALETEEMYKNKLSNNRCP